LGREFPSYCTVKPPPLALRSSPPEQGWREALSVDVPVTEIRINVSADVLFDLGKAMVLPWA